MKHIIATLALIILASLTAFAAGKGAEMTFKNASYDLGTIHASKGKVKATYDFTNTGTEPLIIVNVTNGGCGCTKPDYPKQPIAPGKSGTITITFNPAGRKGELRREVKVKSNAKNGKRQTLKFTGMIIPG